MDSFKSMWADDAIWYPLFLAGKKFTGSFHFENTTTLVKSALKEVRHLPNEDAQQVL